MKQDKGESYDWMRIPLGGGDAVRLQGELENGAGVDVMFSPTLAALMPLEVGTYFDLAENCPRKGEYVSSEMDHYQIFWKSPWIHNNL